MAQFDITINKPSKPILTDDSYEIVPNNMRVLSVLDNDYLGEGLRVLSIEIAPSNGTAVINGTNIEYTPNADYVGTDSFYYRFEDINFEFDIAKVNLQIG